MAEIIRMPKMSDTMTEGTIAAWHKNVGDQVKSGELLAEVETDKATMELESYNDGVLLYIGVDKGASVAVDGVIAVIGKAGEDYQALLGGSSNVKASIPVVVEEAIPAATTQVDVSSIKASVIRMPKMSDTMTEGTIVSWQKKLGDKVKSGELLAEVETDKATMELESYENGTLLYIGVEAGNAVKVDDIIAIIGEPNADFKPLLTSTATSPAPVTSAAKTLPIAEVAATSPVISGSVSDSRHKISPLAKKLAVEKGIDFASLVGTGENGRIVKRDVESFVPAAATSATISTKGSTVSESYEDVPLSQMRKTIARRLSESMYTAPHFYLTMEIEMDNAIKARKSINEFADAKVSFNDMVVKAVANALTRHPKVNASWLGDKIRYNHHVNIGVAVAVDEGLLVPVVRAASEKSLTQISSEIKSLGGKAKNKQLQPSDWEGSTFTISNLGMFGIEEFTAIINPPDACILAVGGIKETVLVKNGQMSAGNVMKVTLSCDHRVVDGAIGAAFLQTLKALLEDPIRLLA